MSVPAPSIGQILGHYRIVKQIGAGGMRVVYRAHNERLDRDVALKMLPAGTLADEATRYPAPQRGSGSRQTRPSQRRDHS